MAPFFPLVEQLRFILSRVIKERYLGRLKRKNLCYSKAEQILRYAIELLIDYLIIN
jgi:uncharacterized protein HemY